MKHTVVLALLGLAVGCSSSPSTNLDDFLGVWTGAGTVNTKCGAGAGKDMPLDEAITITKGIEAPLVVAVGTCSLQMDAAGDTATLRPGQSCAVTRDNVTTSASYTAGNFTIMGIKATFSLSASFTLAGPNGGLAVMCSYLASGTASKMQK
jgi:hypothetical protein